MKRSVSVLSVGIVVVGLSCGIPAIADVPDPVTITAAKTPADHEAVAKAYESEGGKAWHAAQAKHCDKVGSELAAAAKEERALAAQHRKMASAPSK
ncbi:MAG: hypothetical protein ACJ8R9_20125 [Steroidobacteraceae bacterium]